MGEEVRITDCRSVAEEDEEDDRVSEWELGLPTAEDLTPLSQILIPPELAYAFSISPEPSRSVLDVNRASHNTISSLRGHGPSVSNTVFNFKHFADDRAGDSVFREGEGPDPNPDGSDSRKMRKITEEVDSELGNENCNDNCTDDGTGGMGAAAGKRPRLVWTPQLHKRFVDVVTHLGIKNAVPKTIMQLMNVEGLTRENVASHLQKYRLYLKRMQGGEVGSDDVAVTSTSDRLFGSTPVPQSSNESGGSGQNQQQHQHVGMVQIPVVPYHPAAQMVPMPMQFHHGYGMMHQHIDWSGGNKFGSVASYYHNVNPCDGK